MVHSIMMYTCNRNQKDRIRRDEGEAHEIFPQLKYYLNDGHQHNYNELCLNREILAKNMQVARIFPIKDTLVINV